MVMTTGTEVFKNILGTMGIPGRYVGEGALDKNYELIIREYKQPENNSINQLGLKIQ